MVNKERDFGDDGGEVDQEKSNIVKLNIGGSSFSTLRSTLTKKIKDTNENFLPTNLFESILNGNIEVQYDENEAIFIDRNPKYFECVLDYLRNIDDSERGFELPDDGLDLKALFEEAKFYKLQGLADLLEFKIYEHNMNSDILSVQQVKDLYELCGFPVDQKFNLLYRGKRDGFSSWTFHRLCDHKDKVLVVVRSTNEYIFGGYTDQAFDQSWRYKEDPCSFLFSLVNYTGKRAKFVNKSGSQSIYCNSLFGPVFGKGYDLCISTDSNTKTWSSSKLLNSFHPQDASIGNLQAETLLNGSQRFQVKDIEVFQKV